MLGGCSDFRFFHNSDLRSELSVMNVTKCTIAAKKQSNQFNCGAPTCWALLPELEQALSVGLWAGQLTYTMVKTSGKLVCLQAPSLILLASFRYARAGLTTVAVQVLPNLSA